MKGVALGLGCDRGVSLQTLESAVRGALQAAALVLEQVQAAGTIDLKQDEQAILFLAQRHGWPLRFFAATELASVPVPSPSETVRKHVGTPAVAEAAAILAAGTRAEGLILEKYKHKGQDGKNVTVSIAGIRGNEQR